MTTLVKCVLLVICVFPDVAIMPIILNAYVPHYLSDPLGRNIFVLTALARNLERGSKADRGWRH